MTRTGDFDRLARAWLDLMPSEAPDRVIDSVLQAVESTPQVRPNLAYAFRRSSPMNRFSVAAAAAAAVVVAIAGSAYLLSSTQPRTGGPGASATPTAPASPTPGPTATLSPAPAAAALWNDWVADAPPLGLRDQGSRIQLSINWPDGRDIWVQTNYTTGTQVFTSTSVAGPEGQLRVVSQLRGDGCMEGDVGTYAWNRSTNGLFLTLTLVADQCAARATTLARTWVHGDRESCPSTTSRSRCHPDASGSTLTAGPAT